MSVLFYKNFIIINVYIEYITVIIINIIILLYEYNKIQKIKIDQTSL